MDEVQESTEHFADSDFSVTRHGQCSHTGKRHSVGTLTLTSPDVFLAAPVASHAYDVGGNGYVYESPGTLLGTAGRISGCKHEEGFETTQEVRDWVGQSFDPDNWPAPVVYSGSPLPLEGGKDAGSRSAVMREKQKICYLRVHGLSRVTQVESHPTLGDASRDWWE